jgi:four helix bundle protein
MGNIVKSYKELEIWKNGMNIVEIIYEIVSHFPENEKYVLSNQILRASVSIPSNIAEGFGRYSKKDFARFIGIAIRSLFELETQLIIAKNLSYIGTDNFLEIMELIEKESKMLFSFRQKMLETTNN